MYAGSKCDPGAVVAAIKALRDQGNEIDLPALRGLIKGDELMTDRLARTAEGWWAVTPAGLVRLGLAADTTGQLLADRAALEGRRASKPRRPTRSRRCRMRSPAESCTCSAR